MGALTFQVLLKKEPEGGYTVTVPSLPGCVTYGDTIEEAVEMAREAIELYLESLREYEDEDEMSIFSASDTSFCSLREREYEDGIPIEGGDLEYTILAETRPVQSEGAQRAVTYHVSHNPESSRSGIEPPPLEVAVGKGR